MNEVSLRGVGSSTIWANRADRSTLEPRPAEQVSDEDAGAHQERHLDDADDPRGRGYADELRDVQLEADREHEQDHAELGERVDRRSRTRGHPP
jgi:hypothetical protein